MPLTQPGTPIVLDRSSPERRTINEHVGEWRRLVAHLVWDQGVAGSNPVSPTTLSRKRRISATLRVFYSGLCTEL
jgi:hypothetical protein